MKEQTQMKSIEQLKQLEKNPFYNLTDEEKQYLQSQQYTELPESTDADKKESSKKHTSKKNLTKKNVAAKETGKLKKHPSDPSSE